MHRYIYQSNNKLIYCEQTNFIANEFTLPAAFSSWISDTNIDDRQWITYWCFKYCKVLPHEQSLQGNHHWVCQRGSFVAKIPTPASLLLRIILSKQGKIHIFRDVKQNTFPLDSLCLNKNAVNKTPHWLLLVLYT